MTSTCLHCGIQFRKPKTENYLGMAVTNQNCLHEDYNSQVNHCDFTSGNGFNSHVYKNNVYCSDC
jgi:hypothetical protein